jgi:hypothetical protein
MEEKLRRLFINLADFSKTYFNCESIEIFSDVSDNSDSYSFGDEFTGVCISVQLHET